MSGAPDFSPIWSPIRSPISGDVSVNLVAPPTNTVLPNITPSTPILNQTYTVWEGVWTGSPTFTYQWYRDGVAIGSANASTYVSVLADEGKNLTSIVTGTNAGGSASATSNAIGPIVAQRVLLGAASSNNVSTASATYYGAFNAVGATSPVLTTEVQAQYAVRMAGRLKNLRVNFGNNGRGTATTVTVRVNGVDRIAVSSTPSVASVVTNLADTFDVVSGDLIDYAVATGTGTGNVSISTIALELDTGVTASASQFASLGSITFGGARFLRPAGTSAVINVVTTMLSRAPEAGVFSNLQVYFSNNLSATGFNVRSYIRGANGNQLIAVGAAATGLKEDAIGTDSVAVDDTFAISFENPGANVTITQASMKFTPSAIGHSAVNTGTATGINQGLTRYGSLWGPPSTNSASEILSKVSMPYACDFSGMWFRIDSNTLTGTCVATFRLNGRATDMTMTIQAGVGANTFVSFVGDPISVDVGADVCVEFVTAVGTGTITFSGGGFIMSPTIPLPFTPAIYPGSPLAATVI